MWLIPARQKAARKDDNELQNHYQKCFSNVFVPLNQFNCMQRKCLLWWSLLVANIYPDSFNNRFHVFVFFKKILSCFAQNSGNGSLCYSFFSFISILSHSFLTSIQCNAHHQRHATPFSHLIVSANTSSFQPKCAFLVYLFFLFTLLVCLFI